ncbi:MAG: B12-binding domain-containing radical SAM protein [Ruminococcaceae bacterium]|nr:B12-binding domain-containing radical SAM protein [Oscillospiraceae bacterium]
MRVLFINPEPRNYTRTRCTPLGVVALGSYLQAKGHTVKVLNRAIVKTDIAKELDEFKPDFLGCSFTSSMVMKDSIEVSEEAKKRGVCVVWGGQYITCSPELFLDYDCYDLLSLGEGEETWLELCEKKARGDNIYDVRGIAYKNSKGELVKTPDRDFMDLSKLPPMDYGLIDIKKTFYTSYDYKNTASVYFSKGCNGQCTFCYNRAFHKKQYRERDLNVMIQEARQLKEIYGAQALAFADEFFGYSRENMHRICNAFIEADLGLYWGMMTKIGVFNREDLELMYKAGCRWIEFGIESGSKTTLARMKKGMKLERVEEDLRNCKEIGIATLSYFIVGFPGETEEELRETCSLLNKISYTKFVLTFFSPLPGSEIFERVVSEGKYIPPKSVNEAIRRSSRYEPKPNLSNVPSLDLRVVRAHVLWSSFTQKSFIENGKIDYAIVKKDIVDILKSLRGHGFKEGIIQFFASGYEFLDIFFYANFFPGIVKKYGLDLKEKK